MGAPEIPDSGGGNSNFSGFNVESFESMITTLEARTEDVREQVSSLKTSLENESMDTTEATDIIGIIDWVDDELPLLRRRLSLAQVAEAGSPEGLSVTVPEPVTLPTEEELQEARDLANQLNDPHHTDEELAEIINEFAGDLDTSDPDIMSEFFGELGAQNTEMLVRHINRVSETAPQDLQVFSEALGTATMDSDPNSDFAAVRDAFMTPPVHGDHHLTDRAYARLALMQHGNFDEEFVEEVVNANVLDNFAENPNDEFRGDRNNSAVGLPSDTLELAFGALANHPNAARNAINGLPGGVDQTVDTIFDYPDSRGSGTDVVGAFARAANAASGVNDEHWRHHSYEASRFAREYILAVGRHPDVPWLVKDDMSGLAASYRQEFLAGAHTEEFELINVNPAFELTPEETFRYLHGFAENDELMAPFDEAIGELYEVLPSQAARADERAMADGNVDPNNFQNMMGAFGNLAGLQNEAMIDVRGDLDDRDQAIREGIATVLTGGLSEVPGPQGTAAGLAWKAFTYGVGKNADIYTEAEHTRVDEVEEEHRQVTLTIEYGLAQELIDAGYPHPDPPDAIIDENGNLLPVEDIAGNEDAMAAFEDWKASSAATGDRTPFDQKLVNARRAFIGDQELTASRVDGWGLDDDENWDPEDDPDDEDEEE